MQSYHDVIVTISEIPHSACEKQCINSLQFDETKFDSSEIELLCRSICGRENSTVLPGTITNDDVATFESLKCADVNADEGTFLRKELRLLSTNEWRHFVDAVWALRDSATYKIFHFLHHYQQSPGAHHGAAFLVWHREFLCR